MKPARAATFYQMLTAPAATATQAFPATTDLGGDRFTARCDVCRRETVWRAVNIAGRLTAYCLEHDTQEPLP